MAAQEAATPRRALAQLCVCCLAADLPKGPERADGEGEQCDASKNAILIGMPPYVGLSACTMIAFNFFHAAFACCGDSGLITSGTTG
jgi:hypothetical protein